MKSDNKFVLVTDSSSDLPLSYVKVNNIPFISLSFIFNDVSTKDDLGETNDIKGFYKRMRDGEMPSTAQINVGDFNEFFTPFLEKELDILYIGFSSGLSGSFNSSKISSLELMKKYPLRKIVCIDSLCASLGEGLLVHLAVQKIKEGIDLEDLVNYLENTKQKICHWFTVDDLNHLFRGGRVSRASAVLGTLMSIKPILNVDENGKLVAREKIRGRKQALDALIEKIAKYAVNIAEQTVFISHGDCIEDAKYIEHIIRERFKVKDIIINLIGPVLASHAGPGTVAVLFLGKSRGL